MYRSESPVHPDRGTIVNNDVKYVVLNEHTLGYFLGPDRQLMMVLHGLVLKGGHDWKNGSVSIGPRDSVREATREDFVAFRVSSKGHLD
ncbi:MULTISPECIES: hypothetical protein [Halomonas]|uniref:hypothetical protein n=1 Tax=Halomonas TaxID=2745 RepID=UPI0018669D4E|nr:hypothetical protein [Halomonas citrativorans]